jgi:UDP-3-O-[3-hydroxymyristoyl] N-acetylglucosamine deacetylase
MKQKTLTKTISFSGVGLHNGKQVNVLLLPAPLNTGIIFQRTDVGGNNIIPALWNLVHTTNLNTCLKNDNDVTISTIEHLMAALSASNVTNCHIQVNGPEIPILDGSADIFYQTIKPDTTEQKLNQKSIKILKPITTQTVSLIPADEFSIELFIDFPAKIIGTQSFHYRDNFPEISQARTFGFGNEIDYLRKNNLALGGSLDNAIVVANDGETILNDGGLKYNDEFVRHKVIDAIGDLYLAGYPIIGKFIGVGSGHSMNNALLRELFKNQDCWEMV